MRYKKIHIIGGPGSGKSYLAKKLSELFKIKTHDLDILKWDPSAIHYGVNRKIIDRNRMLKNILGKKSWIIEGVYYKWVKNSFEAADITIILDQKRRIRSRNITKRFLKKKAGKHSGKKENLEGLIQMLKWNKEFSNNYFPEIRKTLSGYTKKTLIFDKADKAYEYFVQGN